MTRRARVSCARRVCCVLCTVPHRFVLPGPASFRATRVYPASDVLCPQHAGRSRLLRRSVPAEARVTLCGAGVAPRKRVSVLHVADETNVCAAGERRRVGHCAGSCAAYVSRAVASVSRRALDVAACAVSDRRALLRALGSGKHLGGRAAVPDVLCAPPATSSVQTAPSSMWAGRRAARTYADRRATARLSFNWMAAPRFSKRAFVLPEPFVLRSASVPAVNTSSSSLTAPRLPRFLASASAPASANNNGGQCDEEFQLSPNDCFRTTHRIEHTCTGCGSATVEGDFRARIIGQLAEPIQSLNDHHTFTLQAPDWTAQGWEISVFHDLWARQLGVLNMTEKDIEIRAWLQKLSPAH
ncbi:hypothetical protein C8J57DRAFT_1525741 [Mycena rebaudengoi]|nr:hypothetical protein C8J57DRAFT_1525741 [Mycena rebaudengoi]